eukprot:766337-Hanusia_phi.AAC.4
MAGTRGRQQELGGAGRRSDRRRSDRRRSDRRRGQQRERRRGATGSPRGAKFARVQKEEDVIHLHNISGIELLSKFGRVAGRTITHNDPRAAFRTFLAPCSCDLCSCCVEPG